MVENQAEVLTYLQAGMHSVPDDEVRSAAFLREANMMDLRQLLKRKYSEGKAFGVDEMFEKARTDIASARAANLESQRVGAESTKRFKPAILPANLWPADLQSKLENGLFCPLEETPASQIQNEKQYLQRYLDMKALINDGKNPFASELLEEIPDFEVELVSSGTSAGAHPGTAPEGSEPLSEEAKRLGMLRWCMHHHAGELRMYGGRWVRSRTPEGTPSPIPTWAKPLKHAETVALEKRTHPILSSGDHSLLGLGAGQTDSRCPETCLQGLIRGGFWAEGPDFTWVRESRTWDLPSMLHVYGA